MLKLECIKFIFVLLSISFLYVCDKKNSTTPSSAGIEILGTWEGELADMPTTLIITNKKWEFFITGYTNTYGDVQKFSNENDFCILKWGTGDIDEGEYCKIKWEINNANSINIWIYECYDNIEDASNSNYVDVGSSNFTKALDNSNNQCDCKEGKHTAQFWNNPEIPFYIESNHSKTGSPIPVLYQTS